MKDSEERRKEKERKKGRKGDRETDLQENLIATLNTLNHKNPVPEKRHLP